MPRPGAPEFTVLTARDWRRAAVPGWVPRWVLVAGWVVALVAAVGSAGQPCTVADPTVCGPDRAFAVASVFLLGTPVLLLAGQVALGCLCGMVFAAADVLRDDSAVGRCVFAAHGLACLLVLGWVVAGRRRQGRLARAVAGSADLSTRAVGPGTGLRWGVVAAAVLFGVLGIAGVTQYRYRQADVDAHLAASATVRAQVTRVDGEDGSLALRLPDGRTATVDVQDTDPHRVGGVVPVRVDPPPTAGGAAGSGSPWVALVAEPPDVTGWLAAGLGAIALMLLLVWREAAGWSARRRLFDGPLPALEVLVHPDERGRAELFPVGADPARELPSARVSVVAVPDVDATFPGRPDATEPGAVRSDPWTPARTVEPARGCLLGDLRDAGWVLVVTDDEVLVPTGPLHLVHPPVTGPDGSWARLVHRVTRRPLPQEDRRHGRRGGGGDLPGASGTPVEVDPGIVVPDRPLQLRPTRRARLAPAPALAGLVAGPALVLAGLPHSAYQVVVVLVLGAQLGMAGWHRWRSGIRVDGDGATIVVALRVHRVPWAAVTGLRTDGERLAVAWVAADSHEILELGPFDPAELAELAGPDPSGAAVQPAELTRRVGSVLESLRLAAPRTDREVSTRWSAGSCVLAGYVAVAVVVALIALH